MFDKLVPNTQRRLDNITLESNRYAATPERSPVNVALTGETTARHTNSLVGRARARAIPRVSHMMEERLTWDPRKVKEGVVLCSVTCSKRCERVIWSFCY